MMAEAIFRHEFEYPDNHGITLSDVAATLIAQEKIIPIAIESLTNIYPGLSIEKVTIKFDYAQSGSLKEGLFVAILTAYQKDLERTVPELVEHLTGYHVPDEYRTLVSVLAVLFLYFALKTLSDKITGGKKDDKAGSPSINGNYNTYLNIASDQLKVRPEEIENAIAATVTPKRRNTLIRSALDIIRPAKRGDPGRILVPGLPDISREVVADVPDAAIKDDATPDTQPYERAILEIRATDRDKGDTGWHGRLHVGPMSTSRLSVKLSPEVDREALAKLDTAAVEAVVESRRLDDGSLKPSRIHVLRVLS